MQKRGKDNVVADALSLRDDEPKSYEISAAILEWLDEIRSEYVKDPDTYALIDNPERNPKLKWRNDILWYKGRIYLRVTSRFKAKVLKESHDSPTAGHVGFFKTYYNAKKSFYWKGMYKYIQKYVVECENCQRNKSENVMTLGLLHPLHIPNEKWEEISMDFIKGSPLSESKDEIFVIVD